MSRAADAERKELAVEAAVARAKERLLFGQQVLRYFLDNLSVRETAKALGCSKAKVENWRAILGLQTGRNTWRKGKTTGRVASRSSVAREAAAVH